MVPLFARQDSDTTYTSTLDPAAYVHRLLWFANMHPCFCPPWLGTETPSTTLWWPFQSSQSLGQTFCTWTEQPQGHMGCSTENPFDPLDPWTPRPTNPRRTFIIINEARHGCMYLAMPMPMRNLCLRPSSKTASSLACCDVCCMTTCRREIHEFNYNAYGSKCWVNQTFFSELLLLKRDYFNTWCHRKSYYI